MNYCHTENTAFPVYTSHLVVVRKLSAVNFSEGYFWVPVAKEDQAKTVLVTSNNHAHICCLKEAEEISCKIMYWLDTYVSIATSI